MRWFVCIFLLLFLSRASFGEIIEVQNLDLLREMTREFEEGDLVIFDFDKTLLTVKDAVLLPCGKQCLAGRIHMYAPGISSEKTEDLVSIILLSREMQLVEKQAPEVIEEIQNQGIKVMVCTALRPGKFGRIPKTELWRLGELDRFGLNFRNAFPGVFVELDHFAAVPFPPVLIEGVFASGWIRKGEALAHLFNILDYKPKRVIFIDNSLSHHESVEKWMEALEIPYLGLYYTAYKNHIQEVDEDLASFQIQYLINHERWLSDEEAKAEMTKE
ncbi:MAG: hypothetical protein K940chlam9_01181 [Chlamydiae bacterium]|nr:hypothetical protein [Chlamydiota bacterium]